MVGVHGLVTTPAGIAATQPGIAPERVVLIAPDQTGERIASVSVLASSQTGMNDLGLITTVNQQPTWITGCGWEGVSVRSGAEARGRAVLIQQAPLP